MSLCHKCKIRFADPILGICKHCQEKSINKVDLKGGTVLEEEEDDYPTSDILVPSIMSAMDDVLDLSSNDSTCDPPSTDYSSSDSSTCDNSSSSDSNGSGSDD